MITAKTAQRLIAEFDKDNTDRFLESLDRDIRLACTRGDNKVVLNKLTQNECKLYKKLALDNGYTVSGRQQLFEYSLCIEWSIEN